MPLLTPILQVFQIILVTSAFAIPHRWTDSAKQVVGTAFGIKSSKVWFTVSRGVLSEVYYPRIDRAQVGDSQLLFGDLPQPLIKTLQKNFLEEKADFNIRIVSPEKTNGAPRAAIVGSFENDDFKIEYTKEIITDPYSPVVRIKYRFTSLPEGIKIYLLHKPTGDNDGAHDSAKVLKNKNAFLTWDEETKTTAQIFASSVDLLKTSVGVVGETDGWQDLSKYGKMVNQISKNGPDNIALTALIEPKKEFELAIAFGSNPDEAMSALEASTAKNFGSVRESFDQGWEEFISKISRKDWLKKIPADLRKSLLWDAVVIKTHEDKSHPGAIVASLSIPNIPEGKGAQDGKNTGGYHLVWTRDLFKSAMGLLRLGDTSTALRALNFMSEMEEDGKMSQNTWVDGTPFWHGEQMDQEAFPILLAVALKESGVQIPEDLQGFIKRRISRVKNSSGYTGQERWEEASGFSPNTIAVMAAAMHAIGEDGEALRLVKNTLKTTVVAKGPLSDKTYFLRIAQTGKPDAGEYLQIANGGPLLPEYEILDGGFIEWSRWFKKPSDLFGDYGKALEEAMLNTFPLYDDPENGVFVRYNGLPLYRRYTADAYGVNHNGGPWPILTLERAIPALAKNPKIGLQSIKGIKDLVSSFNNANLCPEQIMKNTRGVAIPMPYAATPLVWCHAEFIELAYQAVLSELAHGPQRRR